MEYHHLLIFFVGMGFGWFAHRFRLTNGTTSATKRPRALPRGTSGPGKPGRPRKPRQAPPESKWKTPAINMDV